MHVLCQRSMHRLDLQERNVVHTLRLQGHRVGEGRGIVEELAARSLPRPPRQRLERFFAPGALAHDVRVAEAVEQPRVNDAQEHGVDAQHEPQQHEEA